jgi:hypothetical protein
VNVTRRYERGRRVAYSEVTRTLQGGTRGVDVWLTRRLLECTRSLRGWFTRRLRGATTRYEGGLLGGYVELRRGTRVVYSEVTRVYEEVREG